MSEISPVQPKSAAESADSTDPLADAPSFTGAAASRTDSLFSFWWRRIRVPLAVFLVLATLFAFTRLDLTIARAVFFVAARGDWVGSHNFWINDVMHDGGTWFIRLLVLIAVGVAVWGSFDVRLRTWRRPALYFALAVILSVGTVGALKTMTNKDCPRDLAEFGGEHVYVPLFGHRSPEIRNARSFPAAHASAGYALLALYFALRERNRRWGRIGLAIGVFTGLLFGLSQQSRGAHFVSHDVWSAFIVWTIALSTYVGIFKARLWGTSPDLRSG
jgi:membrane-associated PAP2 superfamily phosphatase